MAVPSAFDPDLILKRPLRDAIGVRIGYEPEWEPAPGVSKVGGLPNLPAPYDWPRSQGSPMLFLTQIDLTAAAVIDADGLLPPSGFLFFFLKDRIGDINSAESRDISKVLFIADDTPRKITARRLFDLETQYEPRPVSFVRETTTDSGEAHMLRARFAGIDDWLLLLQLDRIWDNTLHDGPRGILRYWISRADLAHRKFDSITVSFHDDNQ